MTAQYLLHDYVTLKPGMTVLIHAAGTDRFILYAQQDFVAETRRFTEGYGAELVLDGVGSAKMTLFASSYS